MHRREVPRLTLVAILAAIVAIFAAPIHGTVEACNCYDPWGLSPCETWFLDDPDVTVSVFCVPGGYGDPLTEARGADGNLHDATIVVKVRDANWDPCPDYPAEDIWLAVLPDDQERVAVCSGGMIADGPTDFEGLAFFTLPLAAGGYSDPANDRMEVYVSGIPLVGPGYDVQVNSADINGDLTVDLSDIALFAQDFFGAYNFRSDFVWDQVLNLTDIGRLANALGASCLPE